LKLFDRLPEALDAVRQLVQRVVGEVPVQCWIQVIDLGGEVVVASEGVNQIGAGLVGLRADPGVLDDTAEAA
jgi:hypothetical protein